MHKTCFECPNIKQTNPRGRPLYYCGEILRKKKEYFYIDQAGTIPRKCPLLKNKKGEKKLIYTLGQKVKYRKVVRKTTRYINPKEFREEEIVLLDKIKIVELNRERYGFITGKRNIAKKAEYTFYDDNPDIEGHIVHYKTETITVYKIAYDMAHTNFVLEEDLKEEAENGRQ